MNTPQLDQKRRRKGQTLVEFAITLPILLILVFGVIEFGRVFQAWVTLQNAARTAARYASTGQFNTDKYILNENQVEDPDSIVDCVLNADMRGTLTNVAVNPGEEVQIYDGREGLFATWYDGENCEPNRIDHQDMRKDIARILSIMDEARRGAAGLSLGPDPLAGASSQEDVSGFLYDQFERPVPGDGQYYHHAGADQPSYFDVMICSSRGSRLDSSTPFINGFGTRFVTVLDPDDLEGITGPDGYDMAVVAERTPVCLLNEQPQAIPGATQNAGTPWYDPGGPGDTVSIAITFNHPLITPLGLAPYIPLEARRAAVNETFRAAEATGALQGGAAITADINLAPIADAKVPTGDDPGAQPNAQPGPNGYIVTVAVGATDGQVFLDGTASSDPDEPEGFIVSWTWHRNLPDGTIEFHRDPDTGEPYNSAQPPPWRLPLGRHEIFLTVTDNEGATGTDTLVVFITTPDPTPEPTNTPAPLPTSTPIQPFSCDLLSAGEVSFFNNRVFIIFQNDNAQPTTMTRAEFHWRQLGAYPNMHVSGMFLDGIAHWRGQDFSPPTDTNADPPTPADLFLSSDRRVPALDEVAWEAVFVNGPQPIQDPFNNIYNMTQHDFAGTTFTFENPEGGFCVIPLDLPTPTPSPTFNANQPTPTASWTPDCAGTDVRIRYAGFQTFGVVQLTVTNLRSVPSQFTDFRINWVRRNGQLLEWVSAGGDSASDRVNGVLVWEANASGQDSSPPTVGGTTSASANEVNSSSGTRGPEGRWVTTYSFPPNSTTSLWIKFGPANSPPDTAFGMRPSDLNGSWFQIGCPEPGGPGSGGGENGGRVTIFQEPSPFPSNTPPPSNTPRPTFTPSKTFTPGPTNTPRPPATITNTPRPTDIPPPTATPTRRPPGSGDDSGGSDGGN